jgi:dihydroorotase-like cyclic amidohydrolase
LQLTRSCLYGVAFTAFAIGSPAGAQAPARSLLLRDVTLIDGTGAPSRAHVSILIRDGRITGLVDAGDPTPEALETIDGRGLFAIPGLFDAHVHIGGDAAAVEVAALGKALRGGVTAVFNMAGDSPTRARSGS